MKNYNRFAPYGITNTGCLGIVTDIRCLYGETYVLLGNSRKSLVRFDADGTPYFMSYRQRWNLSDLMWNN